MTPKPCTMPEEIYALMVNERGVVVISNAPAATRYIRADRYAANLIAETKALRDHCDYLEKQYADLVERKGEGNYG